MPPHEVFMRALSALWLASFALVACGDAAVERAAPSTSAQTLPQTTQTLPTLPPSEVGEDEPDEELPLEQQPPAPPQRDSDGDGIPDHVERVLGTDPYHHDSDGDGLSDLEELQRGLDPLRVDTDGDGLSDREELRLGLNPLLSATYDDQTLDGDRFIARACDTPTPAPLTFHMSDAGDWRLGLSAGLSAVAQASGVASGQEVNAQRFDGADAGVYGVVLTTARRGSGQARVAVYAANVAQQLGAAVELGASWMTHDQHRAHALTLTFATDEASAATARDVLASVLEPSLRGDAPAPQPRDGAMTYTARVVVVERDDRLLTLVALAPSARWRADAQTRARGRELTDTTQLARAAALPRARCLLLPASYRRQPLALYWVLDPSESMRAAMENIAQVVGPVYEALTLAGIPFQLGVTNTDASLKGRLRARTGWHHTLETFYEEVQAYVRECQGCGPRARDAEHGLYSARAGVEAMRDVSTPRALRLREDAQLITIFMTDEEDRSVADEREPLPDAPWTPRAALLDTYRDFFVRHPSVAALISQGDACGADAAAYREVAQAARGLVLDLCSPTLGAQLAQWVLAGPPRPVSLGVALMTSSLSIVLSTTQQPTEGTPVPRHDEEGFSDDGARALIWLNGSYEQRRRDAQAAHLAIHYWAFDTTTKGD